MHSLDEDVHTFYNNEQDNTWSRWHTYRDGKHLPVAIHIHILWFCPFYNQGFNALCAFIILWYKKVSWWSSLLLHPKCFVLRVCIKNGIEWFLPGRAFPLDLCYCLSCLLFSSFLCHLKVLHLVSSAFLTPSNSLSVMIPMASALSFK